MIDVITSFAVRQVGGGVLTVTRTATATDQYDVHGRLVAGTTSTLQIVALVTPPEGRDMQVLQDAQITTDTKVLLTGTRLKSREPGFEPDLITGVDLGGDTYTVFHWDPFPSPDGDLFYRVLAARRSMQ